MRQRSGDFWFAHPFSQLWLLKMMNVNAHKTFFQARAMNGFRESVQSALLWLFGSPLERERRFDRRYRELSDEIRRRPDVISNYVLRGEMLLERRDYERALDDFRAAVELAESFEPEQGLGLLEQAMRDRALQGIDFVARRG